MNYFKVLAIDGGGIKGFYSAKILSLFEAELQRKYGAEARIVDYADLICGTSTGGIIALALSMRVPSAEICNFYETRGQEIFRGAETLAARLRQTLFGGKFSDAALRRALSEMFRDCTMGDSHCLLCIPTFDFTHGTYGVFKFDHKEGNLRRHNSIPMVEVALATSAAPTFFPLAQIAQENDSQYVDGGVWANNPSLVGLTEALWYFVGQGKEYDHLNLLSVASLNSPSSKPPMVSRRRSFLTWAPDLFQLSLTGQSEFADVFLSMLERQQGLGITYSRIPGSVLSRDQTPYIQLDVATPQSFSLMKQLATQMYYEMRGEPNICAFFETPKTYQTTSGYARSRKASL